ncbi:MAG: hypothetical protein ACFFAH_04490 [Promethearchaeota archaeon]
MNKIYNNFKDIIKFYNELKENAKFYYEKRNFEKALKYIYFSASYAWLVHFGKWYDDDLEKILSKIGKIIGKRNPYKKVVFYRKNKRIAYLASFISEVGGHNTVLEQYAHLLKYNFEQQDLYLTKSNMKTLHYSRINKSLKNAGISIYELPTYKSFISKIEYLIKLIQERKPDVLILFTHPNDVIIIPAITALSYKPLIIFFNHADHTFWLGKNIIDRIIEQRIDGVRFSRKYRDIQSPQYIIPLSTNIIPEKVSKMKYGVPETSTLSISIGSFLKVQQYGKFDYFKIISIILKKFPEHYHMFVTTPPSKEYLETILPKDPDIRKRFIINGPFSNLEPIYGIGDFLIDTFPIGGGMVIAGAMSCKVPIVRIHDKQFSLLSNGGGQLPLDYQFVATNINDLIKYISMMIENPKIRKQTGDLLFEYYSDNLSPNSIKKHLIGVIEGDPNFKVNLSDESLNLTELSYNPFIGQKSYLTEKKFFLIMDLKFSVFSIKQRFKILLDLIKKGELKSLKQIIFFTILVTFRNIINILTIPILNLRASNKIIKILLNKLRS